ncbi:hypothetical protein Fmac_020123 [Flemingia macrophylla]|uniref:Uncharacterized protein n=1 Tax=Flemingia macrophylla TaxID=520843 RepID=A0ABD1M9W8_9FABA
MTSEQSATKQDGLLMVVHPKEQNQRKFIFTCQTHGINCYNITKIAVRHTGLCISPEQIPQTSPLVDIHHIEEVWIYQLLVTKKIKNGFSITFLQLQLTGVEAHLGFPLINIYTSIIDYDRSEHPDLVTLLRSI